MGLSEQVGEVALSAHQRQLAKSTGVRPEVLAASTTPIPPFPQELQFLWKCYRELSATRRSNWNGPEPIAYMDILAWCLLHHVQFELWELDTLRSLDDVSLRTYNVMAKKARNRQPSE